jgi:hypothetical protein
MTPYILITGQPLSGKTTLANNLLAAFNAAGKKTALVVWKKNQSAQEMSHILESFNGHDALILETAFRRDIKSLPLPVLFVSLMASPALQTKRLILRTSRHNIPTIRDILTAGKSWRFPQRYTRLDILSYKTVAAFIMANLKDDPMPRSLCHSIFQIASQQTQGPRHPEPDFRNMPMPQGLE